MNYRYKNEGIFNFQKMSGIVAEKMELCWKAHLNGFVNVNWDVVMDKTRKMCIGVFIRDCKGDVRATLAQSKDHIIAHDVAEALAALRAVKFSRELGYSHITLKGDALKIVEALTKCGNNWSGYGHIIEETQGGMNNLQNQKVHLLDAI